MPFPKGGLGSESSGIIRRIGPDVKDLCVGDRVFLMADGSFATHVIGIERMCERIPATLSFEEAVTMPAVFTTTVAALLNIGRLEKGQVSEEFVLPLATRKILSPGSCWLVP